MKKKFLVGEIDGIMEKNYLKIVKENCLCTYGFGEG